MIYKNDLKIKIRLSISAACFFFSAVLIALVFRGIHLVPFCSGGKLSLVSDDAYYQYLDFFSYLKDLLSGEQTIGFSFSNFLGQNCIALFSYYLSSPFNLIIVLFSKSQLHQFFDVLVWIKLSFSAATFSWFITGRFEEYQKRNRAVYGILLSLCYSLMQFSIVHCCNVMWLDGVYMLPLIILGIFKSVRKKDGRLLIFSTAIAVLANWYTAGINILFAGVFLFLELSLSEESFAGIKNITDRKNMFRIVRCISDILTGVMISAFLFLPTVLELRKGRGEGFDWDYLKSLPVTGGNPLFLVRNYSIGATIEWGKVTIFCGCFAFASCVALFLVSDGSIKRYTKAVLAAFLMIVISLYYFKPFFFVFSLFKAPNGHVGRFLYLGCFTLLFLAAFFHEKKRKIDIVKYAVAVATWIVVFCTVHFVFTVSEKKLMWMTVFFIVADAAIIGVCSFNEKVKNGTIASILSVLVVTEVYLNAQFAFAFRVWDKVGSFAEYQANEEKLFNDLKEYDKSFFRVTKNINQSMSCYSTTANCSESLAYGYNSTEGYNSCISSSQIKLFDRAGYRNEMGILLNKYTSILPIDSLLGVKYMLSPFEVKGYKKLERFEEVNGKSVFYNPYVLPMAFKVSNIDNGEKDEDIKLNPFEFQNLLFSVIDSRFNDLFVPADYKETNEDGSELFVISVPEGNYSLYGNITWTEEMNASIDINGKGEVQYSVWNSRQVFSIPYESAGEAYVRLNAKNIENMEDSQFYLLDLDKLSKIKEEINSNTASGIYAGKNKLKCKIEADSDGEYLFLSVPFDGGWEIQVNSKRVSPRKFAECFTLIPLVKGENNIEMTYHIPGAVMGIMLSMIGLVIAFLKEKRRILAKK